VLYTFDQFVLDTDRFEISEDGNAIHAEPQVIELLMFFMRNPGRLITRDELIQAVWKGRVVSDSAISGRIKIARKVLGDDGRQQKYIQTIHKKGFSFIANALTEDTAPTQAEAGQHFVRGSGSSAAIGRHSRDPRPSIGVLKLTNLSQDIEQGYFADGMTEDLITTLSKISKLIVVAHLETVQSGNNAINARRVGIELDVLYVL
jgi:DNA-binding winged helix-turn-helix (wHTH) protein